MKKIIFAILCFVVLITKTYALELHELRINYESEELSGTLYLYNYYIDSGQGFIFNTLPNYKIEDNMTVNNLAYIGYKESDTLMKAAVQMMLLESIYPDYTFTLLKDNSILDISEERTRINAMLEEFLNVLPFENEYTINYGETRRIYTSYSLYQYTTSDNFVKLYDYYMDISNLPKVGKNTIHLTNKINIYNGHIYSNKIAYKPIEITLNTLGNTIKFNIDNLEEYNYTLSIYDNNNRFLGTQNIDNTNPYIYYKNDIGVRIYSVEDISYKDYKAIYLEKNSNQIYEINYNRELVKFKLNIDSYKDDNNQINIIIYDTLFNKVNEVKDNNIHYIELKKGDYIIYDINKKNYEFKIIPNHMTRTINTNVLGIVSKSNIDKIINDGKPVEFIKNDNYYIFDKSVKRNNLIFVIDGNEHKVDLTNKDNYIFINNYGYLYNYIPPIIEKNNDDNESIAPTKIVNEDTDVTEKTKYNNDCVSINVPNTSINTIIIPLSDLYYDKKNIIIPNYTSILYAN